MGLRTSSLLLATMASLSLGPTLASAAPSKFPQFVRLNAFVYEAVTAHSPIGVSRLILTPMDNGAYALDLRIVAPNPTQHKGHIQGLATRNGDRYTLSAANFIEDGTLDDPKPCVLVIDANHSGAQVVSADGCTGFHGAAASFLEQGRNLARAP